MLSTAIGRTLPPSTPSRQAGYRIRGRALQVMRRDNLRERPLCVMCEAAGLVTVATQLDHIVPLSKGGTHERSNLQGLCDSCHKRKTAEELRT